MRIATVLLDNGDKVNRFVLAMSKHSCPIHLATRRYKVDAKSLIGIFGMDLTRPLRVEIGTQEQAEDDPEILAVMQDLAPFAVTP